MAIYQGGWYEKLSTAKLNSAFTTPNLEITPKIHQRTHKL